MGTTLKTLRLYTAEYRHHPWRIALASLLGVGPVLQNIISPLFVAKTIGQLVNHVPINYSYITCVVVGLLGGAILTHLGDRYGSMPLSVISMQNLYKKCMSVLLRQESDFFADRFAGSLVTQANRLAKGYEMFNNVIFLDMLGVWCGVITAVSIMIYYSPLLGVAVGTLWLCSIIVVAKLVARRIPVRRHAAAQESQMTGELADAVSNALTIKTFARETTESNRYAIGIDELSRRFLRSWKLAIRNSFTVQLCCIGLQLLVVIGGILSVQHGSLTIATFLLFQVYILRVIDSVSRSTVQMRLLEGVFGDAADMTELVSRQPVVLDPARPLKTSIKTGLIELADIDFGYDGQRDAKNESFFSGFSLTIQPGERIGLVGPSGGGKTTITKLLLRFMDVQAGGVKIDGIDVREVRQADLHNAISYVPQEPLLFHRSLLENIAYGKPTAPKQEVITAAKRAYADDFIQSLPQGYDTLVGERGIKLSGGQRQRVAIARAMLKNAPILVLDEATSALDSESEKYIQEALWKLMDGKTSVVIAHRLSTIQHLDRIIVLDEGKIIEQGTHAELLKKKGLYAKLWAHQSGGFLEE